MPSQRFLVDLGVGWSRREKVVVFCHFVATGRALRQHSSGALSDAIATMTAEKTGRSPDEPAPYLEQLGERFFDQDSPLRRGCPDTGFPGVPGRGAESMPCT